MRFRIIDRGEEAADFRDVAEAEELKDAVMIVHALLNCGSRNVQLWGLHKWRIAWHVRTHDAAYGQPVRALSLSECLANARQSEGKWRAGEKKKKKAAAFWRDQYPLINAAGYLSQTPERKVPIYRAVELNEFETALSLLEEMKAEGGVA